MTELLPILERLGLEQYLDALVGEGFDTWETVLDIQEGDLDALNVKLGHRRKLQREIATYRGISYDRLVSSPAFEGPLDIIRSTENVQTPTASSERGGPVVETKRKYRRHPKPDDNAPERPPSAYVIFSNRVREEVKAESLSFTAIAKLVGDRWQKLDPADKEPYELQAASAKERYVAELAAYRKTDEYKAHQTYLVEFKAKHGQAQSESKRPKLDNTSSGGSVSAKSQETPEMPLPSQLMGHGRVGSVGSASSSSFVQTLPSPVDRPPTLLSSVSNPYFGPGSSRLPSASPQMASPHASLIQWDNAPRAPLSSRSSVSDESAVTRSDHQDPLPRAAHLSLITSTTSGLGYSILSAADPLPGMDPHWRSTRSLHPQQQELVAQNIPSALPSRFGPGSAGSITSPVSTEEYWRMRPSEPPPGPRQYPEMSRPMYPPGNSGSKVSFGVIQLPPMIGTDRAGELTQDQSQRILPPPIASQQVGYQPGLRGVQQITNSPRSSQSGEPEAGGSWAREESSTPLDTSESAAVSALAGLASTAGSRADSKRPLPRGP